MTHHFLDIQSLTRALESLSGLTGLHYSLYDDREDLLIAPAREDALLLSIKTHRRGQDLYNDFADRVLKVALKRREPLVVQGPTGQYHIFIPLHYKEITMVALAEAFYASSEDFRKFYRTQGAELGLTTRTMENWFRDVKIVSLKKMEENIKDIQSLLENLIASGYEKREMNKRYQWTKTIINLAANIKSNVSTREIYQTIVDTVVFLFNVDTAAVFSRRDGFFHPEVAGGRRREVLQKLRLSEKNQFISKAYTTKSPVSAIDSHELWHTGFPEEIISMYLFPVYSQLGFFGFLGIFNSLLDKEAFDSVRELCRLSAYLCGARHLGEKYEKKIDELNLVSLKTAHLYFMYKEPQVLYDSIVSEAASLVNAEKCSLMLPGDDKDVLSVHAVTGINKWLMQDISVRAGEGIAGRVYEEGTPILVDSEEGLKEYSISPKPQFKTSSCLSLPLKIADEVIGTLNLSDKRSGGSFSEEDLLILSIFALQASILLKLCFCHKTSEEMKELSITDSLTGLFNRRYFDVRLKEEFQRAKRYGLFFSLAIVDIDDFKVFNDTEGHLAGDHILKEIASIMTGTVRANDILVRFGGEEFAIIMPQTSQEEAFHVAERVRENIKTLILPTWKRFPKEQITVSIGLAMYPESGEPMENIIRYADRALYKAKMRGKDLTLSWNDGADNSENAAGLHREINN